MQKSVMFKKKKKKNENKYVKDKKYRKARDHCYYTGKYRDPPHNICNLKYNIPNKIPTGF